MSTIQRRVRVEGRVQGVGFRASTHLQARRHPGLLGWVRNLEDGRVEAVFCGEERAVLEMVAWCLRGPPEAGVSRLEVDEERVDPSLGGFRVRN